MDESLRPSKKDIRSLLLRSQAKTYRQLYVKARLEDNLRIPPDEYEEKLLALPEPTPPQIKDHYRLLIDTGLPLSGILRGADITSESAYRAIDIDFLQPDTSHEIPYWLY